MPDTYAETLRAGHRDSDVVLAFGKLEQFKTQIVLLSLEKNVTYFNGLFSA